MAFELKKRRLLSFLILSTLFLAWSLFVTGKSITLFSNFTLYLTCIYLEAVALHLCLFLCTLRETERERESITCSPVIPVWVLNVTD